MTMVVMTSHLKTHKLKHLNSNTEYLKFCCGLQNDIEMHTTIQNNQVISYYFSKIPCKLYTYKVMEVQYLCFRVLEFSIRNFSKKKQTNYSNSCVLFVYPRETSQVEISPINLIWK